MPALRAVAYYRMSDASQEASIPEQREWARRAAPKAGLELAREFEDHGIPGSEIEDRPGLMALLAHCEAERARKRPVGTVVVWDPDRLSRASSIRTAAVLDRLMTAGVTRIFTPEKTIDLEDDTEVAVFNIQQDFSRAAYSRSIGKNVTRNAADRAARGWLVAGRPPYGYRPVYVTTRDARGKERRTPTTLEFGDDAEVEAVRWIYRQYATTADSLAELVRALNESGAPPPRGRKGAGGRWERWHVWRILTDPVYVGDKAWGGSRQGKYYEHAGGEVRRVKGGGKKRWERAAPGDRVVVRDAHPAMIDRPTFEAVRRKLAASRIATDHQPGRKGEWLLSGLVRCGGCGGRMTGQTRRHKRGARVYTYRRYVCASNWRHGKGSCVYCGAEQDVIVREVARVIKGAFADQSRVRELERELAALAERSEKEAAGERRDLGRRLGELDRQLSAAARNVLLVSDAHRPDAEAALAAMKAERADLAARLEKVAAAAEAGQEYTAAVRDSLAELATIEETIAGATPDKVRTLLGRWVEKITLHFKPPREMNDGRARHELDYIDIDFTPEASNLLPSGAT
jgi:DNA invertase Pin-like site-specific DNA recombinase